MKNYYFNRNYDSVPNTGSFKLHNHNGCEIYMFIRGDAEYIVEGSTYSLNPYDTIIIRNDEMHRVSHKSLREYERFVINIDYGFFSEMDCEEYKKIFTNRQAGTKNKISAHQVKDAGIYDAVMRFERYAAECGEGSDAAVKAVLVEILHLLNNLSIEHEIEPDDKTIKNIISYINRNLTSDLSLENIAGEFYISKYHLCRVFKKATGFTVNSYIAYKRILLAQKFIDSGASIGQAAIEAGFGDYSNFYKTYVKERGISPKNSKNK